MSDSNTSPFLVVFVFLASFLKVVLELHDTEMVVFCAPSLRCFGNFPHLITQTT